MSSLSEKSFASPVGLLRLIADSTSLVAVLFPDHRRPPRLDSQPVSSHDILDRAGAQLAEYFQGERRTFSIPLAQSGTDFQRAVWAALGSIPYGQSRSYRELATLVGRPQAVRAVGSANGRNPLSLFVPCHRVIGSNGALTGYAGGMSAKHWLLKHERAVLEEGVR